MTKLKKYRLIIISLVIVLTLSIGSMSFAAGTQKWIDAWYGTIKISYNGTDVTSAVEPFVTGVGTTYIPLRVVANIFNKNVDYDATTSTAYITDKADSSVTALKAELNTKIAKISELEAKIKKLEDDLDDEDLIDMDDLEEDLNDNYDNYRNIAFDFTLSGDKDDVYVKIVFNYSSYNSVWNTWTDTQKKTFVTKVSEDIQDEYKDAKVQGYVRNSSSSTKLLSFKCDEDGDISIIDEDFANLEVSLNDKYEEYFSDFDISIELEGDEDDIVFNIYFDGSSYRDDWDDESDTNIKNLMEEIFDDIEDEYSDADIEGYVYDSSTDEELAHYWENSSGSPRFERD